MSRTVLAKVEGFTPVIDRVVKDTGSYVTALVFGRMWRFCQMKDGVCNATLETIADGLGMSRSTVMNHAKKLVDAGYLEDRSPGLKNKPHTYIDTGKASLHVGVSAGIDVHLVDVENDDVNLIDTDVHEMNTHVHLKHLKIDSKKDINKELKEEERRKKIIQAATTTTTQSLSIESFSQKVFTEVTGMITIPVSKRVDIMNTIEALRGKYRSVDSMVDYLTPYWREWYSHSNWSKINPAWLTEWAVSGEIPFEKQKKKSLHDILQEAI